MLALDKDDIDEIRRVVQSDAQPKSGLNTLNVNLKRLNENLGRFWQQRHSCLCAKIRNGS